MKAVRVIDLLHAGRPPAGAVIDPKDCGKRASGVWTSTGRVRATGAQERRSTLEIKQRWRGAEYEDLDHGLSRRQNAVGTAALRRTTHTEGAKRSMLIRNVGCRPRTDLLARAERAE